MIATLLRSNDTDELDRLVKTFETGVPVLDKYNRRIGAVIRVWREGNALMADMECVPSLPRRAGLSENIAIQEE